jgi:hypothetical protein
MARWTTLLIAGTLSWPALSLAQNLQPPGGVDSSAVRLAQMTPADADDYLPSVTAPAAPAAVSAQAQPRSRYTTGELFAQAETNAEPAAEPEPIRSGPSGSAPTVVEQQLNVPDVSGMPEPDLKQAQPIPFPTEFPHARAPVAPMPYFPHPEHGCECCEEPECVEGVGGLMLWGEGLYFKLRRTDFTFAFTQVVTDPVTTAVDAFTFETGYDTDYATDFRAGVGYLGESGWMFTSIYTHFDDSSNVQSFTVPAVEDAPANTVVALNYNGPGYFNGISIESTEAGITSTLTASWDFELDTVDLMAGHVWSPTDYLDVIVSGGAKLASVDQTHHTTLRRVDAVALTTRNSIDAAGIDLRGAGPRVGGEMRVFLLPCLAFYARGHATALLASREDESQALFFTTDTTTGALIGVVDRTQTRFQREEIVPVLELAAGGELVLFDGRLILGAGYETNFWYNLGNSSFSDFIGLDSGAGSEPFSTHTGTFTQRTSDVSLDGIYARVVVVW